MQIQNTYYYFKSALTPEECQRIIDAGVSAIDEHNKNANVNFTIAS